MCIQKEDEKLKGDRVGVAAQDGEMCTASMRPRKYCFNKCLHSPSYSSVFRKLLTLCTVWERLLRESQSSFISFREFGNKKIAFHENCSFFPIENFVNPYLLTSTTYLKLGLPVENGCRQLTAPKKTVSVHFTTIPCKLGYHSQ